MTVIGQRPETIVSESSGRHEIIRPGDETRFSIRDHIQEKVNFTTRDTGSINASGFLLPMSRGQSANNISLYLEDFKIYDPLTGLPLIEDLDLKAFGELNFYRGVTPFYFNNTDPISTIQLKHLPMVLKGRSEIGFSYGDPFGSLLRLSNKSPMVNSEFSQVLRVHQTEGEYEFFDNNGTPQNPNDDKTSQRQDNQRQSWFYAPMFRKQFKNSRLKLFGIYSNGKYGIPSQGGQVRTHAKGESQSYNSFFEYTRETLDEILNSYTYGLRLTARQQVKSTTDHNQAILFFGNKRDIDVLSTTVNIPFRIDWDFFDLLIDLESYQGRAEINSDQSEHNVKLKRYSQQVSLGIQSAFFDGFSWELKTRKRIKQSELNNESTEGFDQGASSSLGYQNTFVQAYAQWGVHDRPASLFEQFGDGFSLVGNQYIEDEKIRHQEFGIRFYHDFGSISGTFFDDQVKDKIIFIPSLNNTFKSINLSTTRTRGFEWEFQSPTWYSINLALGYALTDAKDYTDAKAYAIPNIPQRSWNSSLSYRKNDFSFRWHSIYRGQAYADVREVRVLPAALLHHLSFDYEWSSAACGVNIRNVTDVRKLSYGSGPTTSYVPLSEISGYPLPGRHWVSQCRYRF